MSSHHPPLTYKDVKNGLKAMGFTMEPKGSTAHEQWERRDGRGFFKVTVDKHLQPFGQMLIESMASQAGVTKKIFYKFCLNR